jgi:hypothetical protein
MYISLQLFTDMPELSFFHFFCIYVHPFSVVVRRGFLGSSPALGFEGSGL